MGNLEMELRDLEMESRKYLEEQIKWEQEYDHPDYYAQELVRDSFGTKERRNRHHVRKENKVIHRCRHAQKLVRNNLGIKESKERRNRPHIRKERKNVSRCRYYDVNLVKVFKNMNRELINTLR